MGIKRKIYFYVAVVLSFLLLGLCVHRYLKEEEQSYSKDELMSLFEEASLVECARFYVANRTKCHLVEKLYVDSILPLAMYSDYPTVKEINNTLVGTPAHKIIEPFYDEIRELYLDEIKLEIEDNAELMKISLRNDVVAFIELELDSLLTDDITKILNDYSGGFLDYRRIGLFFGRDNKKFEKIWNEGFDESVYNDLISRYLNNYLVNINSYYDDYCESLLNRSEGKKLVLDIPLEVVMEYTSQQDSLVSDYILLAREAMRNETFKDFGYDLIPMIVGGGISVLFPPAAPLGVIVASYGPTVLSTGDLVGSILKNSPTPEELFVSSSVHLTIKYLMVNYIDVYVEEINRKIDERSNLMYNAMCKYL